MKSARIGIDLAKNVFEIHGVDERDNVVIRKTLRREEVGRFFANIPPCLVAMEACSGAYYWARKLTDLGHESRLISPQFVKPYVKTNKSDLNDAEAICEAASRPSMRFVPIKSGEQLSIQAIHRVRSRLVGNRTSLANQIRGILAEFGIVVARNIAALRRRLPEILGSDVVILDPLIRSLMLDLQDELAVADSRVRAYDRRIKQLCKESEVCRRLERIEGIGPLTATALVAAAGNAASFRNGRQFAAWLGLVPRHLSSGGRTRLLGISKRGDRYIRTLLIHGARSALGRIRHKKDPRSQWLQKLCERRPYNIAAVALANKNARIAWALLRHGEVYDQRLSVSAM
ncbi:MAG: IS110 family transposase [bacterium]|nr:IS110 family transposase [bacterium]